MMDSDGTHRHDAAEPSCPNASVTGFNSDQRNATSSFIIQNFPGSKDSVEVKSEDTSDGFHGNNLIHIVNYPAGKRPGQHDPRNKGRNSQQTEVQAFIPDVMHIKSEREDRHNSEDDTPPQLDFCQPSLGLLNRNTTAGNSGPFRKIGEIVTVFHDVNAIKVEPEDNSVPSLLPFSNSDQASAAQSHGHSGDVNGKSTDQNPLLNSSSEYLQGPNFSGTEMSDCLSQRSSSRSSMNLPGSKATSDDDFSGHSGSSEESLSESSGNEEEDISHVCGNQGCRKSFSSARGRTLHMNYCKHSLKKVGDQTSPTHETLKIPENPQIEFYPCPDCGKVFQIRNLLVLHSLTHNEQFPFTCTEEDCDTAFRSEEELATHRKVHKSPKVHRCMEFGCHKVFRSYQGLKMHQTKHMGDSELPYACTKCDKCFRTGSSLKQHLDNSHGEPRPCLICNKVFNNTASLKQHHLVHSDIRPHKCPNIDCEKTFKCKGDLKRHMMLHSKLRPFICPFENCGKSCQMKGDLKKHMVVHLDHKPLECSVCGKFFKNGEHLRKHMNNHEGKRNELGSPRNKYLCSFEGCNKAFPVPIKLRRHEARHNEDKPYKCDECPRSFKVDEDLSVHQRRVHGAPLLRKKWAREPKEGVTTVLPIYSQEGCKISLKDAEQDQKAQVDPGSCDSIRESNADSTDDDDSSVCLYVGCSEVFTNKEELEEHISWHKSTIFK